MTDAKMEVSSPEEVPNEDKPSFVEILDAGWPYAQIDQYSPDGTTVVSRIFFLICPLCAAMVPYPDEEQPWVKQHKDHHVRLGF